MKVIVFRYVILLSLFTNTSCYLHRKSYRISEGTKVDACMKRWTYKDSFDEQNIKVLLFYKKYSFDIQAFPNLVIGVTNGNDTIAIIDKDSEVTIEKFRLVKIKPSIWTDVDKEIYKVGHIISKHAKVNDLFCNVHVAYYGKLYTLN